MIISEYRVEEVDTGRQQLAWGPRLPTDPGLTLARGWRRRHGVLAGAEVATLPGSRGPCSAAAP